MKLKHLQEEIELFIKGDELSDFEEQVTILGKLYTITDVDVDYTEYEHEPDYACDQQYCVEIESLKINSIEARDEEGDRQEWIEDLICKMELK